MFCLSNENFGTFRGPTYIKINILISIVLQHGRYPLHYAYALPEEQGKPFIHLLLERFGSNTEHIADKVSEFVLGKVCLNFLLNLYRVSKSTAMLEEEFPMFGAIVTISSRTRDGISETGN